MKFGENVTVQSNNGYALFYKCSNLTKAYNYPKGITAMTSMFGGTKVTSVPDIPEGVTSLASFLQGVKTITSFPNIPSSVISMKLAFANCVGLSGNLYIESENITDATDAFLGITNYYSVHVKENTTSYTTISSVITTTGFINKDISNLKTVNIISWGDSLTAGAGGSGTSYRSVLNSLITSPHTITNGGVGGESVQSIAARQGGNSIYVGSFSIPATTDGVEINIYDADKKAVSLARQGTAGLNPCYINGIEGSISYNTTDSKYYFTRTSAGTSITINEQTQIITNGMKNNRDDLMIIWAGTNNKPNSISIQNVISYIDKMLEYSNSTEYIIIGLTSKSYMQDVVEVNNILNNKYGEHFLDIRKYLLEHGLEDAELTVTEQDLTDISDGEIPVSLRYDNVHFNSLGYAVVGRQIYHKLISMNYILN